MVTTRSKLIVALIVVLGVLFMLIRTAVIHASTYYVTVGELYGKGSSAVNEETTVSANIVGRTVDWSPNQSLLKFSVQDSKLGRLLPVVFHGPRPDDFANDWPVVVFGRLQSDGTFHADKLLIKCPSKYNAPEQTKTFSSLS